MRLEALPYGFMAYVAIKFIGYVVAGAAIRKREPDATVGKFGFGASRTVIGIALGIPLLYLFSRLHVGYTSPLFFPLLSVASACSWVVSLRIHFGGDDPQWRTLLRRAAYGTLWSRLLDIPAMLAAIALPGGISL